MNSYNIILVDDHPMVRRGIRTFLEEESAHNVIGEVGDGFSLLDLLDNVQPDVILLDITMPKLGGIELIPRILEKQPDIKLIILTMHKNEQYVCSALLAGALGFLLKEDSDTELLCAIDNVMDGQITISPEFKRSFSDDVLNDCHKRQASSRKIALSPREEQILKMISKGITNKEIGEILDISKRTVENHRASLKKRLNAKKTADLVKYAISEGYISPED